MNVIDALEAAQYDGAMVFRPCWNDDPTIEGMVIIWDSKRKGYFAWYPNAPAPDMFSDDDPRLGAQMLTISTENVMAKDWEARYPVTDKTSKRLLICLPRSIHVQRGQVVAYHNNIVGHIISVSSDDLPNYNVSWQNVLVDLTDQGRAYRLQDKWGAGRLDYYLVDAQRVKDGAPVHYHALKLIDKE